MTEGYKCKRDPRQQVTPAMIDRAMIFYKLNKGQVPIITLFQRKFHIGYSTAKELETAVLERSVNDTTR